MPVKITLPSRHLFHGAKYTPAAATDVRKTFAKARAQIKAATEHVAQQKLDLLPQPKPL
jgi:hypothetical protein